LHKPFEFPLMHKSFISSISVLIFLFLVSFSHAQQSDLGFVRNQPPFSGIQSAWVDSVFHSMSPDERLGQLFIVAAWSDKNAEHTQELANIVKKYHIGGLIFFQGGPVRQANMTNYLQSVSKVPLLVAMDAEWGLGMRLDSTISFPRQMMLGAIDNNQHIYDMGAEIARQMKRLGVHVNFAPVVDINNNPKNPVIGSRSFGEDKWNVAAKGLAYMLGLQDNHILAVGKHFPGHGDTNVDSHYDLPVIPFTRERLDSLELFPFVQLINAGLGGIMSAHLHIPALDPASNVAASVSPAIINDLLINELGFSGVVFTDALNMKGVSDYYQPGQLELQALQAGNDLLLFPEDISKAISRLKREIRRKTIKQEEIDVRVKKILALKYWVGLHNDQPVETENLIADLNTTGADLVRRKLIENAITLVENRSDLIPLKRLDTIQIASLSISRAPNTAFQKTLALYSAVDHFHLSKEAAYEEIVTVVNSLLSYDLVILGVHDTDMRATRQFGITPQVSEIIKRLSGNTKLILSVFGSSYSLSFIQGLEDVASIILAYEDNSLTQNYAAQVIFGGIPASGFLPVNASDQYKMGTGIKTFLNTRLKYSVPEEVGMNPEILEAIDTIAGNAISLGAMPGCQVLVAKNGVVVYHKSFGHHTYLGEKKVEDEDLYDLASITKIAASVPAIMDLYEKDLIVPEKALSSLLPELSNTNKGSLVIEDLLTHQAQLQAWIPFFYSAFQVLIPGEELFSRNLSRSYPYMLGNGLFLNRNHRIKEDFFRFFPDTIFSVKVGENFYMNQQYLDTIYKRIIESELRPQKEYLYSDLGYFFMMKAIEKMTGQSMNEYVQKNFYNKLGASALGYLPLERFPKCRIVPTENDLIFRRQLLHGHVHDPATAMIGGVGGHAGLFSNANDLAKLMQMYLWKGEYGGERYFFPSTIERFTSCTFCETGNRRGLGFDKPETDTTKNGPSSKLASPESFGHSGFTGTLAWVDPIHQLVYIFLSNRVHPDQLNNKLTEMNVRTRIQDVIYQSLGRP
jgi:beta-N-acetylhexosaminidase